MSDATIVEDKFDIKCLCPILGYNSLPKYGCIWVCSTQHPMQTVLLSFSTGKCTNDVVHSVTTLQKRSNGIRSNFVGGVFHRGSSGSLKAVQAFTVLWLRLYLYCVCVFCEFFWAFLSWWSALIHSGAALITARFSLRCARCWLKGTLMLCRGRLTGSLFTFILLIAVWPTPLPRLWGPVPNWLSITVPTCQAREQGPATSAESVCGTLFLPSCTSECWDQIKYFPRWHHPSN